MDMENNKIIRMSITFYGRVQGVGFRYRAKYAADGLGLTGWVQNEWDDTVRMEVQGRREDIRQMIRRINAGTFVNIENMDMKEIPVDPEERSFFCAWVLGFGNSFLPFPSVH